MTQEHFADWLSNDSQQISRNMINSYERNTATPSIDVIVNLHDILNIDMNRFLTEKISFNNFADFLNNPTEAMMTIDLITPK